MTDDNLKIFFDKVLKYKPEFSDIEFKSARKGCPEKLYDTLSAFSNQDDGGTIIFGIDESENFEVCGVYDINDIQKRLTLQCKNMEPPVRALYNVIQIDGKDILVMEIPSVSYYEKPCYYKGKGKYEGSYIRVGDADLKMTEFEIYSYESDKKRFCW